MAVGLCVLSIVFLFGGFGETVATADTETDGSISDTHGVGGQGEDVTTATEPTESAPGTGSVGTVPELLAAFDIDPQSTSDLGEPHEESTGLTGPMAIGVSTADEAGGAAAADEDANGSDSVAAAAAQEVNDQEVNEPETVVSHSPVTEPSPEPEAQNADVVAPVNDPPAEEPTVVQPVTNEVASVGETAASVHVDAAPPVSRATPTRDVITALAYFFIALTNDDVSFIEIPRELLSLLGFPLMGDEATASLTAGGIGGSLLAGGLYTAARTQLGSSQAVPAGWAEMLIAPGDSAGLSSAGVLGHSTLEDVGASGVVEQHSDGLKAVLAPGGILEKVRSVLQHTVGAVLAPLSVLALAALASPGVAGLLLLGAAGMFVGYRQARAASMLRAVGIARFAKAGPLGIVRSGGLVAVHVRPSRAARREPPRTRDLLESVA